VAGKSNHFFPLKGGKRDLDLGWRQLNVIIDSRIILDSNSRVTQPRMAPVNYGLEWADGSIVT